MLRTERSHATLPLLIPVLLHCTDNVYGPYSLEEKEKKENKNGKEKRNIDTDTDTYRSQMNLRWGGR